MKIFFYLIFGHLALVLGIIGAFVPVLPTTPFLLLATFLYSKSNPKLHKWVMEHKVLGPPLKDWHDNGVIGLKAKWLASIMIFLIIGLRFPTLNVALWVKLLASFVLVCVLIFIWSRPSKAK